MKIVQKIKNFGKKILVRARHDDLLYLFLELAGGSIILAAPPLGALAIFIKVIQKQQNNFSVNQLKNSFYYFKKRGWIKVEYNKGETAITFSKEGRKRAELWGAGKTLNKKLKEKIKWDKKWRIVMFDLNNNKTIQRNAIRVFLKRCGFILMQKSVWIYPYDCGKEVEFIRLFFRLSEKEFRFITCDDIGENISFRKNFAL